MNAVMRSGRLQRRNRYMRCDRIATRRRVLEWPSPSYSGQRRVGGGVPAAGTPAADLQGPAPTGRHDPGTDREGCRSASNEPTEELLDKQRAIAKMATDELRKRAVRLEMLRRSTAPSGESRRPSRSTGGFRQELGYATGVRVRAARGTVQRRGRRRGVKRRSLV